MNINQNNSTCKTVIFVTVFCDVIGYNVPSSITCRMRKDAERFAAIGLAAESEIYEHKAARPKEWMASEPFEDYRFPCRNHKRFFITSEDAAAEDMYQEWREKNFDRLVEVVRKYGTDVREVEAEIRQIWSFDGNGNEIQSEEIILVGSVNDKEDGNPFIEAAILDD